ncbi:HEAT repeat domain-containing protein [Dictyobacter arantiisoli]|uniref:HEAT repeat-containing PBS lyase n=1 Tax=Dictyobacter arantiisoli TaxID=2014874 RepID=A0A5A5T933_9CHLR|nr:HEAT repeat domain-containing protein [Dictyobacter arantiisoli]GCF07686.1 hypothetical protein KDI_12500 [Dictyobacter arantiisoli]
MQRESIQAALAMLLGPETEYQARIRATRRLAKQGPTILPLVLATLSHYPEITTPAWPWWPPQYEHTSRLLLQLSQHAHINLEEMLQHPGLEDVPGPVLWTSLMEAAGQSPHIDHEQLLCRGLHTAWTSVRYAAAMALATRARTTQLHPTTIEVMKHHQEAHETFPVRLTCAYGLLQSNDYESLQTLLACLQNDIPTEVRKAAIFILASELPLQLTSEQQQQLSLDFLPLLYDEDPEIAQHAAHALSKIAQPELLATLYSCLENANEAVQLIVLTVLEEITHYNKKLRHRMRQHKLIMRILPLLHSTNPDLRRQACYTLASCGGEYGAAVLGTIVMNKDHPGQGEAVECLRFFHGVLRTPFRSNVTRWLLCVLTSQQEEIQVTALDSLTHLLWQAHHSGKQQAWQEIRQEIIGLGKPPQLLQQAQNPLLQQRVLELLAALGDYLVTANEIHWLCQQLLLNASDSGVRACAAYVCGQTKSRWAIPALLQALSDPDEHVAHTALQALTTIATPGDCIVVYALHELTRLQGEENQAASHLARAARTALKHWQRADKDEVYKTLHSFH